MKLFLRILVMMKTQVSLITLMSVMLSLAQPAWSMEDKDLSNSQKRKQPESETQPPQEGGKEEKKAVKRQKGDESNGEELPADDVSLKDYSTVVECFHKLSDILTKMKNDHLSLFCKSNLSMVQKLVEEQAEGFEKTYQKSPPCNDLISEVIAKIMEYLTDQEAYSLARTSRTFYGVYKSENKRRNTLLSYVRRRVNPGNNDGKDMTNFLGQVYAGNPDAIMLLLKAFINLEEDDETEWAPTGREEAYKSEFGCKNPYPDKFGIRRSLIPRYSPQLDKSNPYQVAFRMKHWGIIIPTRWYKKDSPFLLAQLEGLRPEENALLFYKLAPVLIAFDDEHLNRVFKGGPAEHMLTPQFMALYEWMNNFKSEADKVLNIRQRMKLMSFVSLVQRSVGDRPTIDVPTYISHIESLLKAHTPGNSTPHELYKSHVLALQLADDLYWDTGCNETVLRLLSSIDESARKKLNSPWIPADLYLCMNYNHDSSESNFDYQLRMRRPFSLDQDRAIFYYRRAMEKKDDPQQIPFNLQKYLDVIGSFIMAQHSSTKKPNAFPPIINLVNNYKTTELFYHLSWLLKHGIGLPQNHQHSQTYHLLAAKEYYYGGKNTPQNYERAAQLYQIAAADGIAEAQNTLGWMYEQGQGVEKSYNLALEWYQKAAAQGHKFGACNEAYFYQQGWGGDKPNQMVADDIFNKIDKETLSQWKKARNCVRNPQ